MDRRFALRSTRSTTRAAETKSEIGSSIKRMSSSFRTISFRFDVMWVGHLSKMPISDGLSMARAVYMPWIQAAQTRMPTLCPSDSSCATSSRRIFASCEAGGTGKDRGQIAVGIARKRLRTLQTGHQRLRLSTASQTWSSRTTAP